MKKLLILATALIATLSMLCVNALAAVDPSEIIGIAEEERTDASWQWTYVLGDGGAAITGYVEDPAASAATDDGVLARIGGNTFTFSSGAGGWSTEVAVSEDGSFTGYFHDSDMGDTGDDYPNGTRYECRFSGVFAVTEKLDPYTYELRLAALVLEGDTGAARIVDGVKVISAGAYGMEGGDAFMLYCPGRATADLPEAFLEWIRMPNAWEEVPDALPFYGLYNVEAETGFFSYTER